MGTLSLKKEGISCCVGSMLADILLGATFQGKAALLEPSTFAGGSSHGFGAYR